MASNFPQANGSDFVDNWQTGKTLAECNLRMLEKEDSCDVIFRCGPAGHVIKAHSYVLISRSCVFHAMFSGHPAEKSDISVPEIEPVYLKQLLLYLYTDNITVDYDNATALLYASRKYAVSEIEKKCMQFLGNNLTVENACIVLEASHRSNQMDLFEKALTLIKSEGEFSLQSPGFLALSQVLVNQIVESDDFVADEHVIFTAINNWAEAECDRLGREATPEARRSVLGETLYKIRFPLMKQSFLVDNVKLSGLLTSPERLMVQDFIVSPTGSIQPFDNTTRYSSRQYSTSKRRFRNKYQLQWQVGKFADAISFESNRDLLIRGYLLYGQHNSTGKCKYRVTSLLGSDDAVMESVVQGEKVYTADGEVFDVIFPKPVAIKANNLYTLAVKMVGPNTWRGEEGVAAVVCDDGVQLSFNNSVHSSNGTRVSHGQIPAIIYSVR